MTADGKPYPYDRLGSEIIIQISIPQGESRHIVIEYENDFDLAAIDILKKDQRVNLLRKLSDFRDMTLSKNVIGCALTHFYYDTGLNKLGLTRITILLLILIVLSIFSVLYLRKHYKKSHL